MDSSSSTTCGLCRRRMTVTHDNDNRNDLDFVGICGDCKFLLLEDREFTSPNIPRPRRGRRIRHTSSESLENLFSHMINLVGNSVPVPDDQSIDGDGRTSSRTTPSGSRRWRRVLSDTESEGFDNTDSLFGESERSFGFGRYRGFRSESDAVSFSVYGGNSDASVDGYSFAGTEIVFQEDEMSDSTDSDTDIDPMNVRYSQWVMDNPEREDEDEDEREEEEEDDWEAAEVEEDSPEERARAQSRLPNFFISSPSEDNSPVNFLFRRDSLIDWRVGQDRQTSNHDFFSDLEESGIVQFARNPGDYLGSRDLEELVDYLAETDSGRRGAPPAAVSCVNSLPRLIVSEEHNKNGDLLCAICKDGLHIGTEVNQLPCLHIYHPSCILPWLRSRNSCPLCRYELPTDDRDYEEGKQNASLGMEFQQWDILNGSSSDTSDGEEEDARALDGGRINERELPRMEPETSGSDIDRSRSRRGWLFLAAAPIVSLVGIVVVFWLGNRQQRGLDRSCSFPDRRSQQTPIHVLSQSSSQMENRARRWWSFF